jgi:hypothetical protein
MSDQLVAETATYTTRNKHKTGASYPQPVSKPRSNNQVTADNALESMATEIGCHLNVPLKFNDFFFFCCEFK